MRSIDAREVSEVLENERQMIEHGCGKRERRQAFDDASADVELAFPRLGAETALDRADDHVAHDARENNGKRVERRLKNREGRKPIKPNACDHRQTRADGEALDGLVRVHLQRLASQSGTGEHREKVGEEHDDEEKEQHQFA